MTPNPFARMYVLFFALAATYVASWAVTRAAVVTVFGGDAAGMFP